MKLKQYFIVSILCLNAVCALGMDNVPQMDPNAETVINTLEMHCPEAVREIAADWYEKNLTIKWPQLLDFYKSSNLLSKATLPMIRAIWKEICTLRFEPLKKSLLEANCIPQSLIQINDRMKSPRTTSTEKTTIIVVDPNLKEDNPALCDEALTRMKIKTSLMASQLHYSVIDCFAGYPFLGYSADVLTTDEEPRIFQLIDSEKDRNEFLNNIAYFNRKLMTPQDCLDEYFAQINTLVAHKDFFVFILTFDPSLIDQLQKYKDQIVVVTLPKLPTHHESLMTLQHLAIKHNCPPEIIQNLTHINEMIMQSIEKSGSSLTYKILDDFMANAHKIFLTDKQFDKNKAQQFFARDPQ